MAVGFTQGYVELGGQTVTTDGRTSTTNVQRSFPGATVTVYNTGTLVLATIYSDAGITPKSNPFVADSTGYWSFFANEGGYDVKFSGAGIVTPFSLLNWRILASAGLPDPGSNGFIVRTALNTVITRSVVGTTNQIDVTNGNGVAGNATIALPTFIDLTGKTVNGGTFVAPGITNFSAAVHNHENAAGGGQLNATNIFSGGTVPIPRLPGMVGATGVLAGAAGLVPQPQAGDDNKFLRGDGSWQTTGGGGGIPGSPSLSLQYNNAGAFGGITGTSATGASVTFSSAVLIATSPKILSSIFDNNSNEVIGLGSVGSAVNEVTITNAATGVGPSITVTGGDANANLNVSAKGTGVIFSSSNVQINNNAPQVVWTDVNDSKQARITLNGANWQFINDTAGQTPINIDTTNSAITTVGDLFFAKGSSITIGRPSQTDLSLSNTTGVYTFGQIPVLPGSDPSLANQAVRKAYVDAKKTNWSAGFFIYDPSTFPLSSYDQVQKVYFDFGTYMAAGVKAQYSTGTASGSFTVELRSHSATNQAVETTLATVTFNPGSVGGLVTVDINPDVALSDVWVYAKLTARSSPLQRNVSLTLFGFQTLI